MYIKIQFENHYNGIGRSFTANTTYFLTHKQNLTTTNLSLLFIDYSRIDGLPIFELSSAMRTLPYSIKDFVYNSIIIEEVSIVRAIGDHLPKYDNKDENKKNIIDYLFKLYDIKDENLFEKDAYKKIVRDIKIKSIINDCKD